MLTESERAWLADRKPGDWCAYIDCSAWCDRKEGRSQTPYCFSQSCYLDQPSVYRDAAEFEARVAAKLAITGDAWNFEDMPCRGERQYMRSKCPLRKNHWDCADCYIKAARLQVEEEMDNEP